MRPGHTLRTQPRAQTSEQERPPSCMPLTLPINGAPTTSWEAIPYKNEQWMRRCDMHGRTPCRPAPPPVQGWGRACGGARQRSSRAGLTVREQKRRLAHAHALAPPDNLWTDARTVVVDRVKGQSSPQETPTTNDTKRQQDRTRTRGHPHKPSALGPAMQAPDGATRPCLCSGNGARMGERMRREEACARGRHAHRGWLVAPEAREERVKAAGQRAPGGQEMRAGGGAARAGARTPTLHSPPAPPSSLSLPDCARESVAMKEGNPAHGDKC